MARVTQAALDSIKNGIEIEGVKYGPIEATLEREQGSNVWLVMALREGKNREVKNVLGALGLEVNRLIRVSYGPFQLNDIPVGGIETVKASHPARPARQEACRCRRCRFRQRNARGQCRWSASPPVTA